MSSRITPPSVKRSTASSHCLRRAASSGPPLALVITFFSSAQSAGTTAHAAASAGIAVHGERAPVGIVNVAAAPTRSRVRRLAPGHSDGMERTTLVFLHEGLGCIEMWRDFPQRLCDATVCNGIVYDRTSYGRSSPWPRDPGLRYMEIEADEVLHDALAELLLLSWTSSAVR